MESENWKEHWKAISCAYSRKIFLIKVKTSSTNLQQLTWVTAIKIHSFISGTNPYYCNGIP